MTEDDDLDELWEELRPPGPPRPPPPPKPPPSLFGGMPFPRRVHVGLLRDTGHEVDAPSYSRTTTLLRRKTDDDESVAVASGTLTYDVISFPRAPEPWGTIVTLGFYQDDGEPLFFLDLAQPVHMREGDDLKINSPSQGLSLDGVRPPT